MTAVAQCGSGEAGEFLTMTKGFRLPPSFFRGGAATGAGTPKDSARYCARVVPSSGEALGK